MPPVTPKEMQRRLLRERAEAVRAIHQQRPSGGNGLFSSIKTTLGYVRRNPGKIALRSLPFGIGTIFGIRSEAKLERRTRELMIARAKDASRSSNLPAAGQQAFSTLQKAPPQGDFAYRQPSAARLNSPPPQPRPAPFLARSQPPVTSTSRPVASRTAENFRKSFGAPAAKREPRGTFADSIAMRWRAQKRQPSRPTSKSVA